METKIVELSHIVFNTGQLEDVPKNPRMIKNERYKKLLKSIQDDPEMLELRELIIIPFRENEEGIIGYVCIAGNQRLKAMRELKYTETPCKVLDPETPPEKIRAYIIKDNVSFGLDDKDILQDNFSIDELLDFGMEDIGIMTKDKDKTNFDNDNCMYPLIPKFDEKYTAIVIICRTETEEAHVRTKLDIPEKAKSYKSSYLGKTNVIYGDEIK